MIVYAGRCYSFDHRASGFVASEGVVAASIDCSDREDSAASPSARVLSSVARCAGESASLTAPNRDSQALLLSNAWHAAARQPDMLEAHGSGTPLGDPIEIQATLRSLPTKDQGICIGALKAGFGHMLPSSGMASLVKSMQALSHQHACPNALLRVLNPNCAMISGCQERLTFPTTMCRISKSRASSLSCGVTNIAYSGQLVHFVVQPSTPSDARCNGSVIFRFRRSCFSIGNAHVQMAPSSHRGGNASKAGLAALSHDMQAADRSCEMTEVVTQAVREINDRVDMDMPFMDLGVDSLGAAELSSRMSAHLGKSFGPNLIVRACSHD